jgi:hypothetical protein
VRAKLGQRRAGVSASTPSDVALSSCDAGGRPREITESLSCGKARIESAWALLSGASMDAGKKTVVGGLASRAHDFTVGACAAALIAVGCGGSSASPSAVCSLDPTCYVTGGNRTCEVDPRATCTDGVWTCGPGGVLGSGCSPDGGIAPPPEAGADDSGEGDTGCTGPGCQLPSACQDLKCGGPCTLGVNCEPPGDPCYVECTARPDGSAVWVCGGC